MVILCGIDGSASSREAARAAAALARLTKDELELVYVQEAFVFGADALAGGMPVAVANTAHLDADRERMAKELEREGARLAETFGIQVKHAIRTGLPDHELALLAEQEEAELLVVASVGRRAATMWRFGSVADRLSQSSPVPLLVVRNARPFERWALEQRSLSVVLGLGGGRSSAAAARAAQELCKLGPAKLLEAHVYDPVHEARRLGLADPESEETRDRIESALARELPGRERGTTADRFVPLPSRGHVAETLAELAEEERADLVVLGSHRHGALHRRFMGSVSYAVLPMVETNVMIVPATAERAEKRGPRVVKRVLVATDLSETGNAAVEMALGLLPDAGQLVLLHVDVPPELPSGWIMGYHPGAQPSPGERKLKRSLAEAELEKLVQGVERPMETLIEVVEADDVPRAILEAAERHGADLVCLGTHRYGRVTSALIGSVARMVARRCPRPVLLVPSEPER